MKFDLHKPCKTCPFVKDGIAGYQPVRFLGPRAKEIAGNMASSRGGAFNCHMTVDYSDSEDGEGRVTRNTQHCAGALLFMEKVNPGATQIIRIMERLGCYSRNAYSGKEIVFDSVREMVRANR